MRGDCEIMINFVSKFIHSEEEEYQGYHNIRDRFLYCRIRGDVHIQV